MGPACLKVQGVPLNNFLKYVEMKNTISRSDNGTQR